MSAPMYLPGYGMNTDVFYATAPSSTQRHLQIWHKPRNKTMAQFVLVGCGGNGGNGAIGANSTAAGGGGGGSGGVSILTVPLNFLPPVLYINVMQGGGAAASYISVTSNTPTTSPTASYLLLIANSGGNGGNAAGATAGAAGTAGAVATIANNILAGWGNFNFMAGQLGIIGGTTVAGGALTLPTSGACTTGGTGGGGLPAAATAGTNGGMINGSAQTGSPYEIGNRLGGVGAAAATTPAGFGTPGVVLGNHYFLGGTGGGSTHGTATGAGLAQSNGGDGAYGCGGGGSGGALTGSAAGKTGRGGDSICFITTW